MKWEDSQRKLLKVTLCLAAHQNIINQLPFPLDKPAWSSQELIQSLPGIDITLTPPLLKQLKCFWLGKLCRKLYENHKVFN